MIRHFLFFILFVVLLANTVFSQGHGLGLGLTVVNRQVSVLKAGLRLRRNTIRHRIPTLSSTEAPLWVRSTYGIRIFSDRMNLFRYSMDSAVFLGKQRYKFNGSTRILGIAWWPRRSSIDVFLQLVPTIYFEPASHFEFEFGFGVRYFF